MSHSGQGSLMHWEAVCVLYFQSYNSQLPSIHQVLCPPTENPTMWSRLLLKMEKCFTKPAILNVLTTVIVFVYSLKLIFIFIDLYAQAGIESGNSDDGEIISCIVHLAVSSGFCGHIACQEANLDDVKHLKLRLLLSPGVCCHHFTVENSSGGI